MTSQSSNEFTPAAADGSCGSAAGGASSYGPLTPEQIQRWAALIAEGASELPEDLLAPDRQRLAEEVRKLLRARLINVIAEFIAHDIRRRETSARVGSGDDDGSPGGAVAPNPARARPLRQGGRTP